MAADSNPFKFQLKTKDGVFYLTATGAGTTNPAQAVDCTITSGAIACGPNKGGLGTPMHSKMVPYPKAPNNRGWSIVSGNRIRYAPKGKEFNLVTRGGDFWVENCDAHLDGTSFTKGTATAVYA
jgi:hypothetical protein